jgi:aminotransferase
MFGGRPVALQLKEDEGFETNPDDIRKLITDRTKIIVINSPSNPTGSVLDKNILEEIADIAVEHDLLIFSDEAYESLVYDGQHCSIAGLNGMSERVVSFYTFSKTWAIPGFRLGYLCAPLSISEAITKLHPYTTLCAPTVSQTLGTWILENSDKLKHYVDGVRAEYKKRRDFMVRRLNELGLRTLIPRGAFYAFSNITGFSKSSDDFSDMILEKARVVTVPGAEFGKYGEGYVRCSYATPVEKITEAMNRMENALKTMKVKPD